MHQFPVHARQAAHGVGLHVGGCILATMQAQCALPTRQHLADGEASGADRQDDADLVLSMMRSYMR